MQRHEVLGKALVREGVITQEQLDKALLSKEMKSKGMLGRVLVQLRFCSEDDVARVIAQKAGTRLVSLETYPVDTAAMVTIPAELAKKYFALPIGFEDDKLVVAMQQPTDLMALDDLRMLTGYNIKPVVVTDSELDAAIKNYSQSSVSVEHSSDEDAQADEGDNPAFEVSAEQPAVQLANVIISQAVNAKASDVHIEPYEKILKVRFRIDGVLHDVMQPPRQLHAALVSRIKIMSGMNIAERRVPQDGRMSLKLEGKVVDVRAASLPASFGERVTLRLLERSGRTITLEELGVNPDILEKLKKAINLPYGFIPVTGPTGSGKSTTLYASLAAVDKVEKNVITIEDPVEYRMEGINQIQINPKAGLTFASGLRSILRSDPDIVMVGEIRDKETARIAVEAALTGHLVFTTLHTNDAAGAINRLTEMEIEPYLTASSMICVLAQRLARLLCPQCKEPYGITREQAEQIPDFPLEGVGRYVELFRAKQGGCIRCSNTGYRGRVGVYELLFMSETIQRMTLERKSAREIKKAAVAEGMVTLRQDGLKKVRQGFTSIEEILRVIL